MQPFSSSGPEMKKKRFFLTFFIIMRKLHMQWQYDPRKAQLQHKAQICAKFHKRKYNSFCTVVRKRKCDARPPAGRTSFFPTNYNTRGQFLPRVKSSLQLWICRNACKKFHYGITDSKWFFYIKGMVYLKSDTVYYFKIKYRSLYFSRK